MSQADTDSGENLYASMISNQWLQLPLTESVDIVEKDKK